MDVATSDTPCSAGRHVEPLVSVIVPVYNVEPYLDECVASIRAQTYPQLEIIVVDDGSTDGSALVIARHIEDPRVRLLRHPHNRGVSAARNTGIDASTGDYLLFVDADDLLHPQLVELCMHCACAYGCDLVAFDAISFRDTRSIAGNRRACNQPCRQRALSSEEYFLSGKAPWRKLIRSGLIKATGWRFPLGLCYEDNPLHYFLGLEAASKRRLDHALYFRRKRPHSITSSAGRSMLDWFVTQRLSIPEIVSRASGREQELFVRVSYNTASNIVLRIDRDHLRSAIAAWRAFDAEMRSWGLKPDSAPWSAIVAAIVRLPTTISIPLLQLFRNPIAQSIWGILRHGRVQGS